MFYVKNVPAWERILRVLIGMAGLAFAAMNWGASGIAVAGVIVGVMGAMLAMTGLFGFCPMCALVGRKLDKKG
ncbi:MAG: DUF2892 domain-containing protein [Polaromonas sp.]|uniref:YgaP family membrane protein n=1 Tax=Polaromonas sp. TaxID=1869339 RepID=UPI003266772D